jgi:predicted transcriptional regulator
MGFKLAAEVARSVHEEFVARLDVGLVQKNLKKVSIASLGLGQREFKRLERLHAHVPVYVNQRCLHKPR